MAKQIPVADDAVLETRDQGHVNELLSDVAYQRHAIVNVVYLGFRSASGADADIDVRWVLVDCGVSGSARRIIDAAEERFGKGTRPAGILLTHGHFDHIGALEHLAEHWDVPIYAHPLEMPYLNGTTSYPPPDPSVGGGMMSMLSRFYPSRPVNVSRCLQPLPDDGSIPSMPQWKWLHTPGHTPGHISLWRESDRTLIAGDAFVTTAQESAYAVLVQRPELHGPPQYYTPDWDGAERSVQMLAELEPERAITGHGPPLYGADFRSALHVLADQFRRVAVPEQGRYVGRSTESPSQT